MGAHRLHPLPDGKKREAPTKEKLAEFLALSLYGCLFQAYQQNTPLKYCFEVNGGDDTNNRNVSLLPINWTIPEIGGIELKYFENIMKNQILDDFMKLHPGKYLVEIIKHVYFVNIELLRKDTACLVEKHFEFYKTLLDQYNAIIEANYEA